MAMRDENHFFTRRIAERGSDEIVFYSQDRKIQETDPKNVIWDEIIGKEEHLEDGDGYKFQETDSPTFIRDEDDGKEEYLGGCDDIYLSPPCFDSYGDEEVSNEDYWWVMQALNIGLVQDRITVEKKITGGCSKYAKVFTGIERDEDILIYGIENILANKDVGWESIPSVYYKYSCQRETYICGLSIPNYSGHGSSIGPNIYDGNYRRKLTRLVVAMNNNDVPFDPGGCGLTGVVKLVTKLEDEFFRRGRE